MSAQHPVCFDQCRELRVKVVCSETLLCDGGNFPCLGVEAMGRRLPLWLVLFCFVSTVGVADHPDRSDQEFRENRSQYVKFLKLAIVPPGKPILIRHPQGCCQRHGQKM